MPRLSPLHLVLGLGTLAACAEDQSPTQPESGPDAHPSAAVSSAVFVSNSWTLKAAPPAGTFANQGTYGVMPDAAGKPVVYQLGGG